MIRSCETWAGMIQNARLLEEKELRRHASVSTSNRHCCVECFTCACATVLEQRENGAAAIRRAILAK